MGLQDRDWFREETRRRREATRGSQHSRIARPSYRQPTAGSGGSRFKLFVMACLIIGPLWMWAYHENVPISVTAWQAASAAYDSLASFSKEAASDASTVISEEIRSTPHAQEALGETNSQKYAGGSPLNRGEEEIRSTPDAQEEIRSTPDAQEASGETNSQKYAGGSPLNRGEIKQWVIEFTNEERISAGLQPLRHDAAISDIARSHSENMARLGLISHDIGGRDPTDRAMTAGYNCRAYRGDGPYSYGLSENVAEHPRVTQWMGRGRSYNPVDYDRDAEAAARGLVQGWMSSPGHRENILDRDSRRIGVGIAIQEAPEYGYVSETVYATQNFSACK